MTTYYVDGVDGNNGNAGTSEGSGNAWATIDYAMSTVAAGDKVYIKGNGTYSESCTIDTAGTAIAWSVYEGYTTTPGDGGKATINGGTNCLTQAASPAYHLFLNIIFTGASSHGVSFASGDVYWFVNCEFTSNGGAGINGDNQIEFLNCVFANNTANGCDTDVTSVMAGCKAYGNGGTYQIFVSGSLNLYKTLIYGIASGGSGVYSTGWGTGVCIGNTIDGENIAAAAARSVSSCPILVADNIFYDCTNGFISTTTTPYLGALINNLMSSNTTDYNLSTAYVPSEILGYQDVTSAPAFTDEANDDYTLSLASPARQAGLTPGGIT